MSVFMCDGTYHSMRGLLVRPGDVICVRNCIGVDRWFKVVPHQSPVVERCQYCSFYTNKVGKYSLCMHLDAWCRPSDGPCVFKECRHESIVEDLM